MRRNLSVNVFGSFALLAALGIAHTAIGQDATTPHTNMASVNEYIMADRVAEIALARSAAPASISRDAEVQVLGSRGFEIAEKGKNGFVCFVGRGWSSAPDPDFWNPKVRVPMCLNAAAVRTYFLRVTTTTDLALAGRSPAHVNAAISAAVARKELPPMEPGAMCYMMSKEGNGENVIPHWPSHVMFFYSDLDPAIWGANLLGSPVLGVADPSQHLTQFVVPVGRWSDGTAAADGSEHHHP